MNKNRILASQTIENTNRKHKDRLFRLIFSEKRDSLAFYNAINGTNYTNEDDLEINTIEDVIYMSLKNDLSFIIGDSCQKGPGYFGAVDRHRINRGTSCRI